jgi:hypothetical protein
MLETVLTEVTRMTGVATAESRPKGGGNFLSIYTEPW